MCQLFWVENFQNDYSSIRWFADHRSYHLLCFPHKNRCHRMTTFRTFVATKALLKQIATKPYFWTNQRKSTLSNYHIQCFVVSFRMRMAENAVQQFLVFLNYIVKISPHVSSNFVYQRDSNYSSFKAHVLTHRVPMGTRKLFLYLVSNIDISDIQSGKPSLWLEQ